ncbi:hypothetical protein ACFPM0_29095 [Pseudonocardia sulfidoxydans]
MHPHGDMHTSAVPPRARAALTCISRLRAGPAPAETYTSAVGSAPGQH